MSKVKKERSKVSTYKNNKKQTNKIQNDDSDDDVVMTSNVVNNGSIVVNKDPSKNFISNKDYIKALIRYEEEKIRYTLDTTFGNKLKLTKYIGLAIKYYCNDIAIEYIKKYDINIFLLIKDVCKSDNIQILLNYQLNIMHFRVICKMQAYKVLVNYLLNAETKHKTNFKINFKDICKSMFYCASAYLVDGAYNAFMKKFEKYAKLNLESVLKGIARHGNITRFVEMYEKYKNDKNIEKILVSCLEEATKAKSLKLFVTILNKINLNTISEKEYIAIYDKSIEYGSYSIFLLLHGLNPDISSKININESILTVIAHRRVKIFKTIFLQETINVNIDDFTKIMKKLVKTIEINNIYDGIIKYSVKCNSCITTNNSLKREFVLALLAYANVNFINDVLNIPATKYSITSDLITKDVGAIKAYCKNSYQVFKYLMSKYKLTSHVDFKYLLNAIVESNDVRKFNMVLNIMNVLATKDLYKNTNIETFLDKIDFVDIMKNAISTEAYRFIRELLNFYSYTTDYTNSVNFITNLAASKVYYIKPYDLVELFDYALSIKKYNVVIYIIKLTNTLSMESEVFKNIITNLYNKYASIYIDNHSKTQLKLLVNLLI